MAEPDAAVGATTGAPAGTAPAQAIVYGALPGGIHVATADTLAKGVIQVGMLSGYGHRSGLLGSGHSLNRAIGDVAFAYGITDVVSVGLSLDGRYDRHSGLGAADDGYVGDPHLHLRIAKAFGANHVGGQLGVWVPGKDAPSVAASAISVDVRGLVSIPAGPGELSFEAGFRLDNSAKSVDKPMSLSLADRVSLGVSDYNAAFGGAHLQFPAGPKAWVAVEGSLEAFLGDPPAGDAALAEGTLLVRGGASAGYQLDPTWSAIAFVEAAKVPGIEMAQVTAGNIPLIPYEPVVTGGLGLQARFGGPKATYIEKDCHKHDPPDCPDLAVPLLADLTGTVIDDAGKPVVGARVTFTLKNSQVPATATDASGTWKVTGVPVGSTVGGTPTIEEPAIEVAVAVDGKKPGRATVNVTAGGAITVAPIQLEAALPPGQIKGVVRSQAGKPIAGAVITAGDKKTETAADGTFVLDLPPGQYKVTAKSGSSSQDLDVTIDPNGVALKEFVLKK